MYMSIIKIDTNQCLMVQNEELTHESLLEALGHAKRTDVDLLYRKDKDNICVYSSLPLRQDLLTQRHFIVQNVIEVDTIYQQIQNHDIVKVFVRTSPFRKIIVHGKKNSPRITLSNKEERLSWMKQKLTQCGLEIVQDVFNQSLIQENGQTQIPFEHFNKQVSRGKHTIKAYDYIATVKVLDKDAFLNSIQRGIGPYKSYGCGLILVGA